MRKVIITAAVTGSRPTKETNPAVPYSPREIAQAALECQKAGAAIAHVHVRNPITGTPDFKIEYFKEVKDRIQQESNMVVNLTRTILSIRRQ